MPSEITMTGVPEACSTTVRTSRAVSLTPCLSRMKASQVAAPDSSPGRGALLHRSATSIPSRASKETMRFRRLPEALRMSTSGAISEKSRATPCRYGSISDAGESRPAGTQMQASRSHITRSASEALAFGSQRPMNRDLPTTRATTPGTIVNRGVQQPRAPAMRSTDSSDGPGCGGWADRRFVPGSSGRP